MVRDSFILKKSLKTFVLVVFMSLLVACGANKMTIEGLTPKAFDITTKHVGSVILEVSGSPGEGHFGLFSITDKVFLETLQASIEDSKVFTTIRIEGDSDYRLHVFIVRFSPQLIGFKMTTYFETGWILTRLDSDEIVFKELVVSQATATTSDAFNVNKRFLISIERTIHKNIQEGVKRLSELNI